MCDLSYENLSERFTLKAGQRNFQRQYAHIYAQRLASLRPVIEKRSRKKWDGSIPIFKLCDLEKDTRCIIIGTFYKEQPLKPSILKEISEENQLVPVPPRERFYSDNDQLILEDELQRITLVSNVDVQSFVTGIVVAVLGQEREDDLGKFHVEDMLFADLGPQPESPLPTEDYWIAFVSGFNIGNSSDASFVLNAKRLAESSILQNVKHLIIAGNSLGNNATDKDIIANQARYISKKADAASAEGIKHLDTILKLFTGRCIVHIMPGEYDPANYILPQQPLLPVMFPETNGNSEPEGDQKSHSRSVTTQKSNHNLNPQLITVTNPYYFKLGSVDILGTSGQNLKDLYRYSSVDDCMEQLENTIRWRHIAPTCPDTLGCYPYYDKDPFIIDNCPRIYFAGNQNEFKSKAIEGEDGQKCFLFTIPLFSEKRCCVLLNLKSMEIKNETV